MKKSVLNIGLVVKVLTLLFVFLPGVIAVSEGSIQNEIQKASHYAEEYESGNIDYVQFLVYSAGVRERLNEALGTSMKEYGGIAKQEQIRKVLGEPDEETRWVWVEREEREKKLDDAVPVWRKIVFDGKKIQIRLSAFPSLFVRGWNEFEKENFDESEKVNEEKEELVYRLNFEIEFKRAEEQFDIREKIDGIKIFAENFNSNPSEENAENLAKESVNTEKAFENYYRQSPGKCENLMNSILGSENQRESQKLYVQEVYFHEGDNFEVKARLEMCDECEWNWINLDFWFEGRGPGFFEAFKGEGGEKNEEGVTGAIIERVKSVTGKVITGLDVDVQTENDLENRADGQEEILNEDNMQRDGELGKKPSEILDREGEFIEKPGEEKEWKEDEKKPEEFGDFQRRDEYENWNSEDFERAIREEVENVKRAIEEKKFENINKIKEKIWRLNEGWNRKSNEVWHEIDKEFESKRMELEKNNQDPYWWIKFEQEKRKKERELRKRNYEERKSFYLELFSGYDKKEFNYEQKEWEKRLVEEFREFGREICDNNIDDNKNEQVDCDDDNCGGKICGWTEIEVREIFEDEVFETETEKSEGTEQVEKTEQAEKIEEDLENNNAIITGNVIEEGEENSENEVKIEKKKVPMYCIEKACQVRNEDAQIMKKKSICGNHVCENGENIDNCIVDCSGCFAKAMIECPQGSRAIYSGKDKNGCLMNPICVEQGYCEEDEDCKFRCGIGRCAENRCELEKLEECEEEQCADGSEKIKKCDDNTEVIYAVCNNGRWTPINTACSGGEEGEIVEKEDDVAGRECTTKEDCGGENDVCSNGFCKPIVEVVYVDRCEDVDCQEGYHCLPQTGECIADMESPEPEEPSLIEPSQELPQESLTPGQQEQGETEPAPEIQQAETQSQEQQEVTGNVIFNFIRGLIGVFAKPRLTGKVITGFEVNEEGQSETLPEPSPEPQPEPSPEPQPILEPPSEGCPDAGRPPEVQENCWYRERRDDRGCVSGYDVECGERREDGREEKDNRRWEEDNKKRCGEDCKRMCEDNLIQPCVQKCIFGEKGKMCEDEGCLDECKTKCRSEVSLESCVNDCSGKCEKGERIEMEREEPEPPKMEKGVFKAGGTCRNAAGQREEAFIYFDGWGDPFERIQPLKQRFYQREGDWCKWELENLVKQRKEFEKGLNQEFAKWFFEDYLANSAEDWEQHISGIFELYWKNVDNLREIAFRKKCLGQSGISEDEFNLINVKYEGVNGEIEFWEELKEVKMPEMSGKIKMISPYMKVWVFPPKEFIIYEMKQSMKNHEFPGPPEEKMERNNEEGPTAEEREMIKEDEKFMRKIREIADKYGGSVDAVVQFKDYGTNEIVFNLYAEVNEDIILRVSPMLPEEVPAEDVKIEIDFEKVYELISISEREMKGAQIESPPWDRMKLRPMQKVKEAVSGIKIYFKVRDIINSAEITPDDAEKDVEGLVKDFMWMMMESGEGPGGKGGSFEENKGEKVDEGKSPWESKEKVTGEVVLG